MIARAVAAFRALFGRVVGVQGSFRRDIALSVGNTGALHGVNFVLTFGLSVLLARVLGASELGTYAFVLALINILSVPARLGMTSLVLRETAQALARSDWPLMRGLWLWVGGIGLAASAIVCSGLAGAAVLMPELFDADRRPVLLAGMAIIPLLGLGGLINAALRGLHHVPRSVMPDLVVRPAMQVVLIGGLAALGGMAALNAERAMALNAAATAVYFLVAAALLLRHAPQAVLRAGRSRRRTRPWILATIPFALTAGLLQINENTAVLALGAMATDDETGVFRILVQMAMLGSLMLAPVHLVLAPQFARLHAEGERPRLQRMVTQAARADTALALAYWLAMLLFGHWFLGAVFGPAFAAGHGPLMIVLTGQLVASGFGPVGELMSMTGQERVGLACTALGCAVNIGLCLVLVPDHGMAGAAIAVASALMANRAILSLMAWRRLGIATTPLRW